MPEHGRIRIGKQVPSGKGTRPDKISTFRFTSPDSTAIEQIAQTYGGTAHPWDDPAHKGQWEVETLATELPIILPPDCLGGTPIYELWNKGGLLRRCDGATCETPQADGPDGHIMVSQPCVCAATHTEDCKAKIRLQVILREIRFGGAWLLTSSGWNAAQELPGMVDMILNMQDSQLPLGILRLVERTSVRLGKTRHFNVPVLTVDASVNQIAAGGNVLTGGAPSGQAVKELTASDRPFDDPDDHPAEATIVHEWDMEAMTALAEQVTDHWNQAHKVGQTSAIQLLTALAMQITGKDSVVVNELDDDQANKIETLLEEILDGTVELRSIQNRKVTIRRL